MSGRRVLVLADDLTSATEAAGRMGSPAHGATVLLEPLSGPSLCGTDRGCVVTGSRGLSAPDAVAIVEQCLRRHLDDDRPLPIIVKTMDSSLRGQWAAELAAMMRTLSLSLAVVAPAFPAYGRVSRGGVQYAYGVPVHAGPAGRDPRTPVSSSDIGIHLQRAGLQVVQVARPSHDGGLRLSRLVQSERDAPTALVIDAEDDEDLELVARHVGIGRDLVCCAGPGLAQQIVGGAVAAHPSAPPRGQTSLGVIGSLHPATRAQIEHARARGITVVTVTDGARTISRDVVHALRTSGRAVLASPPARVDNPDGLVASVVASVLVALPETALVLSGGDTALSVCTHLGARNIVITGEWATGIPFGRLDNDLGTVVVTKAGGFGGEDAMTLLLDAMTTPDIVAPRGNRHGGVA
ncbi:four-carbon acid sugar kinase family protein [Streptomyces antimycoticus]|uniref:four-carbon acid sugar kinase family protein n=1 Tax=Streptomyces antimycoticus TaxID=68175 RepID=UPI001375356A|nr:four-carbon acid sugar kinase family protein [Streptomyces antimycoticus]